MANLQKINDLDIIEGIKNGKIWIDDYEIDDDKIFFWFYSIYYDNELDDKEMTIDVEEVIEKLHEYYQKVVVYKNQFYFLTNQNYWIDRNDNLEEDADQELVPRKDVLDSIYEIILDRQNADIQYEINVSLPISVKPKDYGMSLTDWHNKSEDEKNQFVINIFNDRIGIQNYNVRKI